MQCIFGTAPSKLLVLPKNLCFYSLPNAYATTMDYIPFVNILPFGSCISPSNPTVIATGTAPCTPIISEPWMPGAVTVSINHFKALSKESICRCNFQGIITIIEPGQNIVTVL